MGTTTTIGDLSSKNSGGSLSEVSWNRRTYRDLDGDSVCQANPRRQPILTSIDDASIGVQRTGGTVPGDLLDIVICGTNQSRAGNKPCSQAMSAKLSYDRTWVMA